MLVQDSYPEKLLQEWDRWRTKHNCENERPGGCANVQIVNYRTAFEFIRRTCMVDAEKFKSQIYVVYPNDNSY